MPISREVARKDWIKGVPVVLHDAQEYDFPIPLRAWMIPKQAGDPWEEVADDYRDDNRHFNRAFWARQAEVIAFREAAEARDMEGWDDLEYLRLAFPLAADLLRRNYDLTDDQVRDLMPYIPGDEGNVRMWRQITMVICHIPPDPNVRPAKPEAPASDAA